MNNLDAVIVAGGFGTRVSQVYNMPKPLIKVGPKELICYAIDHCINFKLRKIHIILHHRSAEIEDFVLARYFSHKERIVIHIEETPLGSGGGILEILPQLSDTFFTFFSDTVLEVDLERFFSFHNAMDARITLFAHPNNHPHDSDKLIVDKNSYVTKIIPKTDRSNNDYGNLVNAALYCFDKKPLLSLRSQAIKQPDLTIDIVGKVVNSGQNVAAFQSVEYVKDSGTPNRVKAVSRDLTYRQHIKRSIGFAKPAIFLDRDGILIQEDGYITNTEQVNLTDNIGSAIEQINKSDFISVIVTNQPSIAMGKITFEKYFEITRKIQRLLANKNSFIDRWYFCPHHPEKGFEDEIPDLKIECNCRKPDIGMLIQAINENNINVQTSFLVGDRYSDIVAADKLNIRPILTTTGSKFKQDQLYTRPYAIFKDAATAIAYCLNDDERILAKCEGYLSIISKEISRVLLLSTDGPSVQNIGLIISWLLKLQGRMSNVVFLSDEIELRSDGKFDQLIIDANIKQYVKKLDSKLTIYCKTYSTNMLPDNIDVIIDV